VVLLCAAYSLPAALLLLSVHGPALLPAAFVTAAHTRLHEHLLAAEHAAAAHGLAVWACNSRQHGVQQRVMTTSALATSMPYIS
jgi:hypothetical protein